MQVNVAFTPEEVLEAPVAVVVDVMRATSTIAQALASGYERVFCCREVLLGSLLNLSAVARAVREDCVIVCAGFQGRFALDDAYCAGRIVQLLDGEVTDTAKASAVLAGAYPTAWDGLMARTYGPPGLDEDIRFCAQEDTIDVVPRLARMVDPAAEIVAG